MLYTLSKSTNEKGSMLSTSKQSPDYFTTARKVRLFTLAANIALLVVLFVLATSI
jgi:hypothetical protein